ncbi:murein DD-endopeptidase MepM/ murein hydrolase activator NlpD [Aeromicrobium panaciterrae]|uniref:Murein DD-endopeptidase MepM/ murein hydrolase activator NlpD n=1 Tax=Aeromicrobium panaciterrae TaxID=363861 RepID=A0ABU1UQG3_9ACTN|nr:peptidoglycan DD-metalloendopeptidase family protein [Aeromicrobium panaciterrae]MDR7087417.1 murein DD-endopeptidase MepM/ murein hydrolase activator NlpD [Aeromicrobium panaciterrae]
MNRRSFLVLVLVVASLVPNGPATAGGSEPWIWPLPWHDIRQRFDKPESAYGPGHRGVDLAASVGDPVRAVAAGRVAFTGPVAGIPVVTIEHGRERSTYQPVSSPLKVGDSVAAGQEIGTLLGSPSHCAGSCLHLGRVVGKDDYLDPLELLSSGRYRLISPHGKPPAPPASGNGSLDRPVGGPVTSAFGMRVHPVTGVRKLHDGIDFGVSCGTPVHAAAAGTVVRRSRSAAYGKRIVIRHRPGLETSYNHLSRQSVSTGERVGRGTVIGRSGNTGLSTGCHLHFMVVKNGHAVNPSKFL